MGWHPEKVNQATVSASCETIAVEFAKGTDNVIDDIAAAQTGKAISFVLNKMLGAPAMMGSSTSELELVFDPPFKVVEAEAKEDRIKNIAKKVGISLNPTLLAFLKNLAIPMIQQILDQLKAS